MNVQITTHLNFRGQAREALDFYRGVFGGEQTIVTYGMLGAASDPSQAEKVMWGQIAASDGFRLMAYDVQPEKGYAAGENAFYVSARGDDPAEMTARWERLAAGATMLQPIGPSAWSPLSGMLRDRFGITWIVDVAPAHAAH